MVVRIDNASYYNKNFDFFPLSSIQTIFHILSACKSGFFRRTRTHPGATYPVSYSLRNKTQTSSSNLYMKRNLTMRRRKAYLSVEQIFDIQLSSQYLSRKTSINFSLVQMAGRLFGEQERTEISCNNGIPESCLQISSPMLTPTTSIFLLARSYRNKEYR